MSISQALNNSLSGLRATQAGLALISANVANAQTAGYVRKSLQLTTNVSGESSGSAVRVTFMRRIAPSHGVCFSTAPLPAASKLAG